VGGQALARYVLDHPELVRNRCVLDFATGGGIVGIAAAMAGARRVIATDLDPRALAAAAKNAELNGVSLELRGEDWVGQRPPVDVLLSGDICYERSVAERLTRWFSDLAQDGLPVFLGDGGRAFLPQRGLIVLHRASVATTREIESQSQREATVYRVSDAGCE
jgi:predicted nicotinamide N-methyase